MNLRDQLKEVLPSVLPHNPVDAIKGTDLIRLVRYRLSQEYTDATLRYHFSIMCADPTAPIAKVEQGQGYYLRELKTDYSDWEPMVQTPMFPDLEGETGSPMEDARRKKMRAIMLRLHEAEARFPFFPAPVALASSDLEDSWQISREWSLGWRVPDCIVVDWEMGEAMEEGVLFDKDMLHLRQNLGAQVFRLTSQTIEIGVHERNYREVFFRCVSAGDWAHQAELILAETPSDELILDRLRTLSQKHGVKITTLGLTRELLDSLTNETGIRAMTPGEFDALHAQMSILKLSPGRRQQNLDWEELYRLKREFPAFERLIEWVNDCCRQKRAMTYLSYETRLTSKNA